MLKVDWLMIESAINLTSTPWRAYDSKVTSQRIVSLTLTQTIKIVRSLGSESICDRFLSLGILDLGKILALVCVN